MSNVYLGVPAVRQILAKESKSDAEDQKLIEKLERSCKNFDHSKKGRLTPDDFFNVVKLQNGIAISKDEVRAIMAPLPRDKEGRVKIDDFLHTDIHSPQAFKAIDRNKDGFITKGELKLAKKSVGMKDIDKVIRENDLDGDGKLNMDEYEKSGGGKRKSKEKKK